MITHEQAKMYTSLLYKSKLFEYITQQEKKDKLLELYRFLFKQFDNPYHEDALDILKEIKIYEEKLNEKV